MTDDEILARIEQKVSALETRYPRATLAAVRDAEARLGFALPALYVRLLTEVANGGFGPEELIIGLPPTGYVEESLQADSVEAYLQGRAHENPAYRDPIGTIYLASLGCGEDLHLDCLDPDARVLFSEAYEDGIGFSIAWPSFREYLQKWLDGVDLHEDMTEIVGYRDGINPFTRQPHRFPLTRIRRGPADLTGRR